MNYWADATREVYWNISHHWVMYVALVPTMVIAAYGLWRRFRLWRIGQPAMAFDRLPERLDLLIRNGLLQMRTVRDGWAAMFHTGLFAGFIVLFLATVVVFIHEDSKMVGLDLQIMQGPFYLFFQSFIVDLFGLWVVFGVCIAMLRRFRVKPAKLIYTSEANLLLWLIFGMAATGFLIEGWRIAVTDDLWGMWSPVGYAVALVSDAFLSDEAMRGAHRFTWWFHMSLVYGFLAYAPFTKMAHAVISPLNIFTAKLGPYGGALSTIDFETAERLGVNSLRDMTWKDLLDLDACTECGRCTAVCPANTVGKELSPRDIIVGLRDFMHANSEQLLAEARAAQASNGDSPAQNGDGAALTIIQDGTPYGPGPLFECTTCAACMQACPVNIEQMPKIVDARRYLVMEEAQFPEGMQEAVTSLEARQHPYPGTQFNRTDWAEGLEIPILSEMDSPEEAEVLFWVGCGGALVERNHRTVQATAKLLQKAGVKFAILGREESCSGDPARRIGNEFLFEMLAKGNVDTLNGYGVKRIVTSCPHCFNTFANEYPHFDGHFEVRHHSEFLAELVREGALEPEAQGHKLVTYHDPCYLSRHNAITEEPRQLTESALRHIVEMPRHGKESFCCGGGGGMAFVDEPPDKRVNQERAQEAIDTGAQIVAVGCPFCATMLDDGVNTRKGERDVKVMDVAEMLFHAVEKGEETRRQALDQLIDEATTEVGDTV